VVNVIAVAVIKGQQKRAWWEGLIGRSQRSKKVFHPDHVVVVTDVLDLASELFNRETLDIGYLLRFRSRTKWYMTIVTLRSAWGITTCVLLLPSAQPTIDDKVLTGDVARGIGRQIDQGTDHLIRPCHSAHRDSAE